MKLLQEKDLIRGWFVGNFTPTIFDTDNCEVAVKRYKKGDYEQFHHHKIATEITMIISGKVKMNGQVYKKGDIILVSPNEGTDFKALTNTTNVVVKVPCVKGDKYIK